MAWQDTQAAFVPLKTAWPRRTSPDARASAATPRSGPSAFRHRRSGGRKGPPLRSCTFGPNVSRRGRNVSARSDASAGEALSAATSFNPRASSRACSNAPSSAVDLERSDGADRVDEDRELLGREAGLPEQARRGAAIGHRVLGVEAIAEVNEQVGSDAVEAARDGRQRVEPQRVGQAGVAAGARAGPRSTRRRVPWEPPSRSRAPRRPLPGRRPRRPCGSPRRGHGPTPPVRP